MSEQISSLKEEIAVHRAEINSDGYPMSIGELINLYRDGELDIHPEFQRFYRWSDEQKSRLIESILLGIPIPSIFVSQREDGVWDVIDGLQRLATIFQLVGLLKDESGVLVPPLKLNKTRYLPSLEGVTWDDENGTPIGSENQLIVRRSKIDIKIILRESSESSKYELFQRLNTGGSQLSDQELRNVVVLMANPDAYNWFTELAEDAKFKSCIALSDKNLLEQYHVELALRFVVFRKLPTPDMKSIGDIGTFLTEEAVRLAEPDTFLRLRDKEEKAFSFTFAEIEKELGENSFRRYDVNKGRHLGGFLISAFEAIAIGVGFSYEKFSESSTSPRIKSFADDIWSDSEFIAKSGSGVSAKTRVPAIIPLGRKLFAP